METAGPSKLGAQFGYISNPLATGSNLASTSHRWPPAGPQPRRADILNSILNPGDARGMVSDDHQQHIGSDSPEIVGVARDDGLLRPPRTNDDVGINYVGCSGSCQ